MIDVSLELVRFFLVGMIMWSLLQAGRREGVRDVAGWRYIIFGFGLVLFGALIDITDNFPELNRFVVIGDTEVQAFIEKVVGYLFGFSMIAVGFWMWMPRIAKLKVAEQELIKLREDLEQQVEHHKQMHLKEPSEGVDEEKNRFLTDMSQELRTSLSGIVGFADILADMDLAEEPRHFVQVIKTSADELLQIVDEFLDQSEMQVDKLTFHEKEFNLRVVLEQIHTKMGLAAEAKSLALTWDIDNSVPDPLVGDPLRLVQVVEKLVDNGIKFTENGSVGLKVKVAEVDDGSVQLVFTVSDTGVGVTEGQRDEIFKFISQKDGSGPSVPASDGPEHSLPLASRLVRIMGGKIWVEDNEDAGKGSVFIFTARFGRSPAQSSLVDNQDLFASIGRRIMLVEDDKVNQMLAMRIMKWQGWEVTAVDNGREALEAFNDNQYDLILTDVRMPEMDGLEVSAAIRAIEKSKGLKRVKILALTALTMPGDRELCMDAGMDGYIEKPFRAEDLVDAIERHLA